MGERNALLDGEVVVSRDACLDVDDAICVQLRERVRQCQPHQPEPGDPDYLTPEQIEWIREGEEDEVMS